MKVKMKVLGVFIYWLDSHFYDIADDIKLRDTMLEFFSGLYSLNYGEWLKGAIKQIETLIKKKFDELNKENARLKQFYHEIEDAPISGPYYVKFLKKSIFEFPPEEVCLHA